MVSLEKGTLSHLPVTVLCLWGLLGSAEVCKQNLIETLGDVEGEK